MVPTVFVSHGAPTLAIEPGPTASFLRDLGRRLGRPRAILCASAHWEASEARVTRALHPETLHDFAGFPESLDAVRYPAPGDPALADRVVALIEAAGIPARADDRRGLDHGAWVPLSLMYPEASTPVIQVAVQSAAGAARHLALGRALAPLRREGVLILGSGGATHDLRALGVARGGAPAYARAFDDWLRDAVEEGRTADLTAWDSRAPEARRNHPTPEHFLPLFVPLGAGADHPDAARSGAPGRRIHAGFAYGALSMAAFLWGEARNGRTAAPVLD